jgi:carboxyl-terminal processing protease
MKIHITRKQVTNLAFPLILCVVWFLIGWIVRGWLLGADIVLIEQARQGLLSNYPGELPSTRELTYAAIRGMLHRVDPYGALFEPVVSRRYLDDFSGQSGLVGLVAEVQNGAMVVTGVLPGGPAERADLRPGDVILYVDGVKFDENITETEASILIRGPVGTAAHFVVRRGDQTLEFDPVRQERAIASTQMLDGQVAYLAQRVFTTNAPQKVKAALQELLAQHPKALIWDLRGNTGGSMDATQAILSYFIEDGLLYTAEVKGGQQQQFMAQGTGIATGIPLIVLIDRQTYSSAETAAAVIKERGRGLLIGSTTHGKGTIQTTLPLIEDNLLHFTIAKWLSPTGKWYEGIGVTPDISVSDDPGTEKDEVLQSAVDYIRRNLAN